MAIVRNPQLRLASFGLAFLALLLGVVVFLRVGSAVQPVQLLYTDSITTKQNAHPGTPNLQDIEITVAGLTGPMDSVRVLSNGAPGPGSLQIDTSDLATWKPAVKVNATTWSFTSRATNAVTSGVHINGHFSPSAAARHWWLSSRGRDAQECT